MANCNGASEGSVLYTRSLTVEAAELDETGFIRSASGDRILPNSDSTDNAAAAASHPPPKLMAAVEPMSKIKIILLNISFLGLNLMFLVLSVVVVPSQVQAMVGSGSKGSVLGGMVAGGAVLTLVSGPLIGMISDRLVCRFGRRRPVMVVSTFCLCAGLIGMGLTSPDVQFKRLSEARNGTSELDDNGMCNIDLATERCKPYYTSTNSTHRHNPYLEDLQPKKVLLETKEDNVAVIASSDHTGSLLLFVPFYLLVTVSYVCTITPYNALIADRAHPSQRGLSSGVMGGMILLGNIAGAALGLFLVPLGILGIYAVVVGILVLCIAITVASIGEPYCKERHPPIVCRDFVTAFFLPLKEHDFRWVFITRFLMQQGLSTVVGFLEYWLSDMVNLPNCWHPAKGVSLLLIPLLCTAAISSVISGLISDRMGRRKPIVIIASILMAASSGLLAALRGDRAYYIAAINAVVFGVSFGAYQAVDFALLMDVLPAENDKSRDIAVWQQALVLPQALAVPVGGFILDGFERVNCRLGLGYIILFSLTAVYFLLSGLFVGKIRRAK